tara:strand:+ start:1077 stop:1451 length:375 start_codon:yes stop_codon:yes gene_type:complete
MYKHLINIDKNTLSVSLYHKSNKIMIPFLVPSFFLDDKNSNKKLFDLFNICNLGFHSYFSFSTIITDYYKKIPFTNENLLKILNLKTHCFLIFFFSYNLYNKYYNNEKKYNKLNRYDTIIYKNN